MASGHLCLNLSENVSWEDFPAYANALLNILGGSRTDTVESVEMRIWEVSFAGSGVRFVYDDYPAMVSLESRDEEGDVVLRELCPQNDARPGLNGPEEMAGLENMSVLFHGHHSSFHPGFGQSTFALCSPDTTTMTLRATPAGTTGNA